jgi:hypothetical protein
MSIDATIAAGIPLVFVFLACAVAGFAVGYVATRWGADHD